MADAELGLVRKYDVRRLLPSSRGINHDNCAYFVLDPKHDEIAREALLTYAKVSLRRGSEALARDIFEWLRRISAEEQDLKMSRERIELRLNEPENRDE